MAKRVLLGIDFIGSNCANARQSIEEWWHYILRSEDYACIVGISNFCERQKSLPGSVDFFPTEALRELSSIIPENQLTQWTSDIDAHLLGIVQGSQCCSQPFYSEFNYGSVINRLLLLGYAYECDYLIRIDPGTLPPQDKDGSADFATLMTDHEHIIGSDPNTVVSRRYADRSALRHMFVKSGQEESHAHLIIEYTGIKVKSQVTGGAMLTMKLPGVPAICFPKGSGLTLVWASDDGIYQVLPQTKKNSAMMKDHPVERFDAVGKQKKSTEYYRGILGAVYLKAVRDGKSADLAQLEAEIFIETLKNEILDHRKCREIDEDPDWIKMFCLDAVAPHPFLEAVAVGYENHSVLLDEWDQICRLLKPLIVQETNAKSLLK